MVKLIVLAALGLYACYRLTGRWPWQIWQAWARPSATQAARSLLGVGAQAGREEIIAAHKRLITKVHPDKGGSAPLVHEANAARDLLLRQLPQGQ